MIANITVRNVNEALEEGIWRLRVEGVNQQSRNGRVLTLETPLITTYESPLERVLFSPLRDANPFFHLYESLWMLAGRNDVAPVAAFVERMNSFSDDGRTLHGAYGYRWRNLFYVDQLEKVVNILRRDPDDRRAVIQMWSAKDDLGQAWKDVPCNTQVYFRTRVGFLDMTVLNRSNDLVWGAYGANYVHMGFLHEFVAEFAGYTVGRYHQFTNNAHIYPDRPDVRRLISTEGPRSDWKVHYASDNRYARPNAIVPERIPLVGPENMDVWFQECERVVSMPTSTGSPLRFFDRVALPMLRAYFAYKLGKIDEALNELAHCDAQDWAAAGSEWIARRRPEALIVTNPEHHSV